MSALLRLPGPKFYTRLLNLKDHQSWGVDRTALIQSWKITESGVTAKMVINGIVLEPTGDLDFLDGSVFDIPRIRQALRNVVPMTEQENALCRLESTLFSTQLTATEYFRYFDSSHLFSLLFTGDLCVSFLPQAGSAEAGLPQRIAIEETYTLSEAQLLQRLRNGETLQDIDTRCRDELQTESMSI